MRSIGERTQSPAKATASFADRGTRGSRRRRRTVATHAGSTVAKSLAEPGGKRLARTIITSHDNTNTVKPINNHFSTRQKSIDGRHRSAERLTTGHSRRD